MTESYAATFRRKDDLYLIPTCYQPFSKYSLKNRLWFQRIDRNNSHFPFVHNQIYGRLASKGCPKCTWKAFTAIKHLHETEKDILIHNILLTFSMETMHHIHMVGSLLTIR